MAKFKWLVVLVFFLMAVPPSFADDSAKVLGIWKLVSFEIEVQATGERRPILGKNPTGYAIFTPEKRVMFFIEGEGRKAPQTNEDRIVLHQTMLAYTGIYRFEGDKFITKVDAS